MVKKNRIKSLVLSASNICTVSCSRSFLQMFHVVHFQRNDFLKQFNLETYKSYASKCPAYIGANEPFPSHRISINAIVIQFKKIEKPLYINGSLFPFKNFFFQCVKSV